ncbi:hypothetical protein UA44_24915, partial [Klebsiella aerogenes]
MPQRVNPAEKGIVLESLSAGYGQTLIVDDINLTIPSGKMTVLAGANGSGKSTLLSTIARMGKMTVLAGANGSGKSTLL